MDIDGYGIKSEAHTLESYVRLKELLDIDRGIDIHRAKEYDDFKLHQPDMYQELMRVLDNRMHKFQGVGMGPWNVTHQMSGKYPNLSNYLFTVACFPTHIAHFTRDMSKEDFIKALDQVQKYRFSFE